MTIGTSIGGFYEDEHSYHSRHSRLPQPKDNNELHPDSLEKPEVAVPLNVSMNSGFHQSDNVEDRRNEFFDPRTDNPNPDMPPGSWYSRDLEDPEGNAPNTSLGIQLGATQLDIERTKQIDDQIQWMSEQKKKADDFWADKPIPTWEPNTEEEKQMKDRVDDFWKRKSDDEVRQESGS